MGTGPWKLAHFMEKKAKELGSRTGLGTRGAVWSIFYRQRSRKGVLLKGQDEILVQGTRGPIHGRLWKGEGLGSCLSFLLLTMPGGSHLPWAVLSQNTARDFFFLKQMKATLPPPPRGKSNSSPSREEKRPSPAGVSGPRPALTFPCPTKASAETF